MKLGMDFPQQWKEKSIKDHIPLSDILYGYAVENLMLRLEKTSFQEYLWLTNEQAVGEAAYRKKVKERLEFLYVESGKKNFHDHIVAGQPFDAEILKLLQQELFEENDSEMHWDCIVGEEGAGAYFLLTCTYMDMHVPITMRIDVAQLTNQKPKVRELPLLFEDKKVCSYYSYSKESILSETIFEIMRKLELISDMEVYDIANEIIKSQTISGRHILEDFNAMAEKEPKVASMKRLEQISSYKNYGYMKKRWQQYVRNHKEKGEEWEIVMERLLSFIAPLWKALCENEIFFDDWMPELERFLG